MDKIDMDGWCFRKWNGFRGGENICEVDFISSILSSFGRLENVLESYVVYNVQPAHDVLINLGPT